MLNRWNFLRAPFHKFLSALVLDYWRFTSRYFTSKTANAFFPFRRLVHRDELRSLMLQSLLDEKFAHKSADRLLLSQTFSVRLSVRSTLAKIRSAFLCNEPFTVHRKSPLSPRKNQGVTENLVIWRLMPTFHLKHTVLKGLHKDYRNDTADCTGSGVLRSLSP